MHGSLHTAVLIRLVSKSVNLLISTVFILVLTSTMIVGPLNCDSFCKVCLLCMHSLYVQQESWLRTCITTTHCGCRGDMLGKNCYLLYKLLLFLMDARMLWSLHTEAPLDLFVQLQLCLVQVYTLPHIDVCLYTHSHIHRYVCLHTCKSASSCKSS